MAVGDMVQYNVVNTEAEAANAANGLTAELLLPQDGKIITAQDYAAGKSPVELSIQRLAQRIAGIRGALWGNIAGIAKRTVHSVKADGTGGSTHTLAGGMLSGKNLELISDTATAYIQNLAATLVYVMGPAGGTVADTAGGTYNYRSNYQNWTGTVAGGSNPAKTDDFKNYLFPLNLCKYWITFTTDGAGAITYDDGFSGATLSIVGAKIVVTFPNDFVNEDYAVVANAGAAGTPAACLAAAADKAVGSCKVKVGSIDPAATAIDGSILIFGRQTT